jgi:hypothetical protein
MKFLTNRVPQRKKKMDDSTKVERRLRDEVFLLAPVYRNYFSYALFDKTTNTLHGTKYSLHYCNGHISIR